MTKTAVHATAAPNRLHAVVRLSVIAVLIVAAVSPTVLTLYLRAEGGLERMALAPDFHVVAISLAIAFSAFVTYVAYRAYLESGKLFQKWLLWGLVAFTVIYAPHGFLTNVAVDTGNPWVFLLYGPASRLVLGLCWLMAALRYGRVTAAPSAAAMRRATAIWVGGCVLLCLGVYGLAVSPLAGERWVRWSMEIGAVVALALSMVILLTRRASGQFIVTLAIVEFIFIQASIAFMGTMAWSHLWWYAHIIFAAGFLLLSYQVATVYLSGIAFEHALSQGELLRKLSEANVRYQRSNQELSQFAHLVSHDLQAPLRRIASFIDLTEEELGPRANAHIRTYLDFIRDSAGSLRALVQRILDLSSAESRPLEWSAVDLNGVLDDVMALFAEDAQKLDARIEHDDLPTVRGDRMLLTQVFQNLLQNAIKYRRPEVPLRVRVYAQPRGAWWQIAVADNGRGFDMSQAEKAFQMLTRLHGEEVSGSGAGLAICNRIVKRHGGHIDVTAAVDQGATFQVLLPAVDNVDQADGSGY
ncbi:MAG: ATP-binding protein [Oceanococcaceae bacterium]